MLYENALFGSRELKARLGEQAHLLDEYLITLMESMNRTPSYDAITDGFECISKLRELCRDVIRGEKKNMDRPFYRQAEDFIGTNSLDCREVSTKISIYIKTAQTKNGGELVGLSVRRFPTVFVQFIVETYNWDLTA